MNLHLPTNPQPLQLEHKWLCKWLLKAYFSNKKSTTFLDNVNSYSGFLTLLAYQPVDDIIPEPLSLSDTRSDLSLTRRT